MVDVQIGKNKYKLTLTILIAVGTFVVGAISWVLSLQMTVEANNQTISELKAEIGAIAIPDTTDLETKDAEMSTKIMWMLPRVESLDEKLDDFNARLSEIEGTQRVIENDMRSIMSEHNSFNEILREMGKAGYGDTREYGNYD